MKHPSVIAAFPNILSVNKKRQRPNNTQKYFVQQDEAVKLQTFATVKERMDFVRNDNRERQHELSKVDRMTKQSVEKKSINAHQVFQFESTVSEPSNGPELIQEVITGNPNDDWLRMNPALEEAATTGDRITSIASLHDSEFKRLCSDGPPLYFVIAASHHATLYIHWQNAYYSVGLGYALNENNEPIPHPNFTRESDTVRQAALDNSKGIQRLFATVNLHFSAVSQKHKELAALYSPETRRCMDPEFFKMMLVDCGIFKSEHLNRIKTYLPHIQRAKLEVFNVQKKELADNKGYIYSICDVYGEYEMDSVYSGWDTFNTDEHTNNCTSFIEKVFPDRINCQQFHRWVGNDTPTLSNPAECHNKSRLNINKAIQDMLNADSNRLNDALTLMCYRLITQQNS